jgi:hypothetical protein
MTQIEQPELALAREPQQVAVPIEMIRAKKTAGAAFTLACDASGLDDKEIYLTLGIDAGYFSNIKKGKATLQADLITPFCDVVGNRIYPEWMAYQIGCTLVQIKSEAERRLEQALEQLAQERVKVRVLTEAIGGRAA